MEQYLKNNNQRCHYELSIEEMNTDHLLNEKHPLLLRLLPEQWKYYRFHLQHSNDEAVSLEIHVDSLNGFHEVCISKSETRPNKKKECFMSLAFNSNNQGLYTNYQTLKIQMKQTPDKKLEGIYYIVIHSYTFTSLYLNAVVTRTTDDSNSIKNMGPLYYKHLKAGGIMSDKIDHPADVRLFNFTVNLPEGENVLSINIIPVRGKFRLAVRNDEKEPDEEQKYWNTDDHHLLIKSSTDPLFKRHAEYKVAVWANVTKEQVKSYKRTKDPLNYQFRIRYSH